MIREGNKCPCHGCEERTEYGRCHSTCERYLKWKEGERAIDEKVAAKKSKTQDAREFQNRRYKGWNKA